MHTKLCGEPCRQQQINHLCIATAGSWCQFRDHTTRAQQHGGCQQQGNSGHACLWCRNGSAMCRQRRQVGPARAQVVLVWERNVDSSLLGVLCS